MKTQIITFALILTSLTIYAQKTYLKVYKNKSLTDIVMYPPGTKFELKNKHGYIVMKYSETPRVLKIKDEFELIVFPHYKKDPEFIKLTEGKVELALTSEFSDSNSESIQVNGDKIVANKKLSDSQKIKGNKNVTFRLSNGIVFKYTDGKYSAHLGNQDLPIKGKYIITSNLGELKLSFNNKTGELWWYFDSK